MNVISSIRLGLVELFRSAAESSHKPGDDPNNMRVGGAFLVVLLAIPLFIWPEAHWVLWLVLVAMVFRVMMNMEAEVIAGDMSPRPHSGFSDIVGEAVLYYAIAGLGLFDAAAVKEMVWVAVAIEIIGKAFIPHHDNLLNLRFVGKSLRAITFTLPVILKAFGLPIETWLEGWFPQWLVGLGFFHYALMGFTLNARFTAKPPSFYLRFLAMDENVNKIKDPDKLADRGMVFFYRDKFEDAALRCFQRAVALNPATARAHFGIGLYRWWEDEHDDAIEALNEAQRLGCDHIDLYITRAKCSFAMDYEVDLIADTDIVLERGERYLMRFYRGWAHHEVGDFDEAISDFTIALESVPSDMDRERLLHYRAKSHIERGNIDAALEDIAGSRACETDDDGEAYQRAVMLRDLDEFEEAMIDINRSIELDPDDDDSYELRGELHEILGNKEEAEADFTTMMELYSEEEIDMSDDRYVIYNTIHYHFNKMPMENIVSISRSFPSRAAPEIQVALDSFGYSKFIVRCFLSTRDSGGDPVRRLQEAYEIDRRYPIKPSPPRYQDFDIGEDKPFRCLRDGIWLLEWEQTPLMVILDTCGCDTCRIEVSSPLNDRSDALSNAVFDHIERTIQQGRCYRGKILSLEYREMYSGQAQGLVVHKLKQVSRDEVILPAKTVDLLDRNVLRFVQRRADMAKIGLPSKKGLLFYGPPGTGKTHTIHYLASNLEGHTTFIISAEQVTQLSTYMTLARMLQPSVVIIEDVDLIARNRGDMHSPLEESLLNKLLNEMDGLRTDAEVLFILTTNRAEALEHALAARPGRVDQAIEFPLPDDEGRFKLVRLYAMSATISDELIHHVVSQTRGVTASFIKELMRRAIQNAFESRNHANQLERNDLDLALDELLRGGGPLNRMLLGATGIDGQSASQGNGS